MNPFRTMRAALLNTCDRGKICEETRCTRDTRFLRLLLHTFPCVIRASASWKDMPRLLKILLQEMSYHDL